MPGSAGALPAVAAVPVGGVSNVSGTAADVNTGAAWQVGSSGPNSANVTVPGTSGMLASVTVAASPSVAPTTTVAAGDAVVVIVADAAAGATSNAPSPSTSHVT